MALLCVPFAGRAANLTTTAVQAGGSDWTAAIWQTNGAGPAATPVAGNTYQCLFNGTPFGNNKNNTRIRNPTLSGTVTFAGDSLTLNTNSELRIKATTVGGTGPMLNFPGVGGNPGLILNGGVLNVGDDGVFVLTGKVQVAAQSYIAPADAGGGAVRPLRGVNLAGQLSGTGNVVIFQAGTNVAQQVSGLSNSFSGQWMVKAGWLLASTTNSLGTNSITIDPNYVLPLDASILNVAGPAIFEPAYDLNSAGKLILTNGGTMVLHQSCVFRSATIEGTTLTNGIHSYAELAASFPTNFAPGGSGFIAFQPYGAPPAFPPSITSQPASLSQSLGTVAQLSATASGPPTSYQWQKGTNGIFVNATDTGDVTGSRSNLLSFSSLAYADAADYRLVVTNSGGMATSQVATVTVLAPVGVAAVNPAAGSTVGTLSQVQVIFNRAVTGVDPGDLLVNGQPAASVSPAVGGGSNYTFSFTQPAPGTVSIGWDAGEGITDLAGNPFNRNAPGASWTYTLVDTTLPTVSRLTPPAGATVSHLGQIEVSFSRPVVGVQASALLINSQAATNVSGSGSGPYLFQFAPPASGIVQFAWATPNGITDTASPPNAFAGGNWSCVLNPAAGPPMVRINELLVDNISTNGLKDQFGNLNPWLELYNFGTNDLNLTGFALTDDPSVPDLWVLPAVVLPAGQYLVVFADGLDITSSSPWHTSFSLSTSGDYLGLFDNQSPRVALTEFAPQYPAQRNDTSYGYDGTNQLKYFSVPSPGAPNGFSSITGVVADVSFSVPRGFFNQPFTLTLSNASPGATIRFTTDGSQPTVSTTGSTYTNPLTIDHLMVVRAAAFATNALPSLVATHSYLFLTNVLNQPTNPPGFPITTGWSLNGWASEYGVNPLVVTNPLYAAEIIDDLRAVPTLSIAVKTDDMFGPNGIYTNSPPTTTRPEIACSTELIFPDGTAGFQLDCGVKIHGGGSAQRPMKKPLALKFQSTYGPGSLKYQFFADSPVKSFDGGLVLRADYNNSWTHSLSPYSSASLVQRARGGLVRDAFFKDLQLAMGDLGSHSRYVHLYINGLYWGLYNPCEDPDQHFAAAYLGGSPDDYDSVKGSDSTLSIDGDAAGYNYLLSLNNSSLANLSQYNQMQQYLDVKQFADYMLLQFYGANQDWGTQQNWIAIHNKKVPGALWEFLCWDDERTLEGSNDTPVGSSLNSVSPGNLQANLVLNAEYRLLFADRAYKFLFNNGVLTPNAVAQLWLARANQIYQAIVGESARWGDSVPGGKLPVSPLPYPSYDPNTPYYSRNENWLGEQGRLLTNYFPARTVIVANQLRSAGLYPPVDAPVFNQFGGHVPLGFGLSMTATSGTIYYTTNGADPRVYGSGAVSPQAVVYSNALTLTASSVVRARVLQGTTWSALAEATFTVGSLGIPLCITELMYNPPGGDTYEFLELQNVGGLVLDLSGYSFQGINFIFPNGTLLQPGAVLVLANNASPSAWAARYPGVSVFGYYGGKLDNSGERIAVLDRNGQTVTAVSYDNANGWPKGADGGGYSLEIIDPFGDPNAPANWRASSLPNGTPGLAPVAPPLGSVLLNELMAANTTAVQNGTNYPDWAELYNRSSNTVSVANWSLSNSGNTRKYVFPAGTSLPSGGYLVVWLDSATNDPGLHSGFNLSKSGDNLFLFDANTNRQDAVSFGQQVSDLSLGRINGQWQLTLPTPNASNAPAVLDVATNLALNEWLANPAPGGSNWVEVYNRSAKAPVSLRGVYFSTTNSLCQVRSLSFLPTNGFLQLVADQAPDPSHVDLTLPASNGVLVLYDNTGVQLESVPTSAQSAGVSQGRFPDGAPTFYSMPIPTPGAPNVIPNHPPVLNLLSNRFVHLGQTLQFTATASDPDSWYQTLSFSLSNSPAGATINPQSGQFSWLVTGLAAPSTNVVTVRVTDNGVPPLSDAKSFLVWVEPALQIASAQPDGHGHLSFSFNSWPGQVYQLQYKDALTDPQWSSLGSQVAGTGTLLILTDTITTQSHRFYRVVVTTP